MTLLQQASYLKVNMSSSNNKNYCAALVQLEKIGLLGHSHYPLMFSTRHLLRHTPVDNDVHRGNVFLGSEVRGLQC